MAASQCPKCGHLFEVRDGSGEPLPLAHCTSCDAYYPAHVHSCKWCGTTLIPEKARKGESNRVRWIAAGTFAVAVLLGFLARDPGPRAEAARASRPRATNHAKLEAAAPPETVARAAVSSPAETTNPIDSAASANEVLTDVSTPATAEPASAEPAVVPQSASVLAAGAAARVETPRHVTSATAPHDRRASTPWVTMVAKQWVTVRADAERGAHIVASVGPNARVQLGEARGA
ncbi:MAG TPA: hypothetical protein VL549_05650, partial [Gemmatimonadales bacterium]|nr:hypothetical protein [Gemmatimonadales bacterium]